MNTFRFPSTIESLETRRLLASFASVSSHGTLSIVGTSKADTIVAQTSGSKVQAIVNGATESFSTSAVKRIWIEAFGGNDKITNKTALSSTLIGDAGNDTIVGGGANDTIDAGSGDDHFDGGLGTNFIDEGSGNDAFDYSSEPGSQFNIDNFAEASLPSQSISVFRNFGAGEDDALEQPNLTTFIGTPGNDQVSFRLTNLNSDATFKFYLGAGNDSATTDALSDPALLVDGGDGNDTIEWNIDSSIVSVLGGAGNDTINDDAGAGAYIDGGSGFDTDNVNPDDEIAGNALNDYTVPAGIEKYSVGVQYNLIVNGNGLDNIISAFGQNVTVYGNGGNDQITAVAGSSQLNPSWGHASVDGGSGDDLLHATASNDSTLKGGSGNDTLVGDAGIDDQGPTNPNFVYEGDSGTDTADFSDQTANLTLHIDGQPDSGAPGQKDLIMGDIENITGGSGNDLITGNFANNRLEGGAGNDTIWGGSGNDTLIGDAGHDQLHGQDGNDILYGRDGQTDTLDGGNGYDQAQRDDSTGVKDQVLSIESFI